VARKRRVPKLKFQVVLAPPTCDKRSSQIAKRPGIDPN